MRPGFRWSENRQAGQAGHFITSDNYIEYFAAVEGEPDHLPCWVFGRPSRPEATLVQGPLSVEDLKEVLGFI